MAFCLAFRRRGVGMEGVFIAVGAFQDNE